MTLVSFEHFCTGRAKGTAIKYKQGTYTRRFLWLSPSFSAAHAEIARLVTSISTGTGSKWKLMANKQLWIDKAVVWASSPMNAIALVTPDEKSSPELRVCDKKQLKTKAEFLTLILQAEMEGSTFNMCGM